MSASLADLDATKWLKAEFLLVSNPDGTLHRYARVGDSLIPLEPTRNPEYAAPVDKLETAAADAAYLAQTLLELGNPPEMVMLQEPNEDEITINTDSRLVDEFLLDPATIVFLDDVANEYGVEDPAFFGAMVASIIYRELQDPRGFGLPVAAFPRHQHYWDAAKRLGQSPFFLTEQIVRIFDRDFDLEGRFDGDPSLGIGALSREAGKNIQSDAERLGMTMYFPALGFDRPTNLDHMPFSPGEHFVTQRFFVGSLDPDMRVLRAIPPSNEKQGVWRVEIPRFEHGPSASLREQYEPTLGIIAAEVTIAMRTPEYQELQSDEQRIAYIIGYHANRSRVPGKDIYDLSNLADESRKQTRNEIRWAEEFEGLMNEIRTEIQNDAQYE